MMLISKVHVLVIINRTFMEVNFIVTFLGRTTRQYRFLPFYIRILDTYDYWKQDS